MQRRIAITGVGQGLGRSLAHRFITLGHTVCGCDLDGGAIAQLQQQYAAPHQFQSDPFQSRLFQSHLFQSVDVTRPDQVNAWAESILEQGAPDLLINNAGYTPPMAAFWDLPAVEFDRTLAVNVQGVVNVLRAFLPAMVAQQRGIIVNLSARWGRQGAANAAAYCASKWAIEGLTQAIALELPAGMAAVTFSPGAVHTHALEVVYGAEKAATYPSPDEWAEQAAETLLAIAPEQNGQALP
ncbi:SDR family oxidoreductase [Thermoleptolyngbya oregonensis NK1-22]|uniref:SDR family oxidoreductase n=1 Tax=Thermoleptolyngbya oregonensis NK1-22 TaxID=2547457 RepID=A0AA97BQM5_9CYAN|nr:SDR family oxidoreductase [Thermoleptolyngbya oregonensis]WOB44353.1 SDR family oxidoreductase [Thermoleptolyngbya oregonensis NK1-22]